MTMHFEESVMHLSSGRTVETPHCALALDNDLDVWTVDGGDGSHLIEQNDEATHLTPDEAREIALMMIDRWARFGSLRSEMPADKIHFECIRERAGVTGEGSADSPHEFADSPRHFAGRRGHHER